MGKHDKCDILVFWLERASIQLNLSAVLSAEI